MYAPVGISVFNRELHFRTCIDAITRCDLASGTDLFVFSDGALLAKDQKKVSAIRSFAKTISGFKSVSVIEREGNSRVFNNRDGHRMLLNAYGRMIWLEDDIEVAPGFLRYMNDALEMYEECQDVFSVSAYCPPIDQSNELLEKDTFFSNRFNAWGFGIWKDRYEMISKIQAKDLQQVDLCRLDQLGCDLPAKVIREVIGTLNALDVRAMFWQTVHNKYTLCPSLSLSRNHGFDGSGAHSSTVSTFDIENLWGKRDDFTFDSNIMLNQNLVNQMKELRKIKFVSYVKVRLLWVYLKYIVPKLSFMKKKEVP